MTTRDGNEIVPPVMGGAAEYLGRLEELAKNKDAQFFHLSARLPRQGRTDTIYAASDTMSVILKTYALAGENELHRHPGEDHMFVVLDGEAEFMGRNGEITRVGKYDGVFLPDTAYYCFKAVGDEPLVLLRVGAKTEPSGGIVSRYDPLEQPTEGLYQGKKAVELILHEDKFFG